MPDIALCDGKYITGDSCPKKDTCYRHIAKPDPYRQSYACFDGEGCYIECKSKGQFRRLNIQCEGER